MARYENKALRLYQEEGETQLLAADYLQGKKVLALSGIGNPASFQQSLEECGGEVIHHFIYPDHYQFTDQDIEDILNWPCWKAELTDTERDSEASNKGTEEEAGLEKVDLLVTTEKDLARLKKNMLALLKGKYRLAVLEIEVKIDGEEEFLDCLLQAQGKEVQEGSN